MSVAPAGTLRPEMNSRGINPNCVMDLVKTNEKNLTSTKEDLLKRVKFGVDSARRPGDLTTRLRIPRAIKLLHGRKVVCGS